MPGASPRPTTGETPQSPAATAPLLGELSGTAGTARRGRRALHSLAPPQRSFVLSLAFAGKCVYNTHAKHRGYVALDAVGALWKTLIFG